MVHQHERRIRPAILSPKPIHLARDPILDLRLARRYSQSIEVMSVPSLSPNIYVCELDNLSIEYASTTVPPEFKPAWSWFQSMEGRLIPRLPSGRDAPPEVPIKLAAQRGIHTPKEADLTGGWREGRKYAVTIYTSTGRRYADKSLIARPDGTWLLEYKEQKTEHGREMKWDQNRPLLNCLEDGVPVGVLAGQPRGGYRVLGLAFVERYDARSGFFTLHGPVNAATERQGVFSVPLGEGLSTSEADRILELKRLVIENGDERVRALVNNVRREQQSKFRSDVYSAYGGRCAASETAVNDILQAAHIDDFRGKKSQVVQNGILLRVDIHMLYDANLLGIEPDSHRIVLSDCVDLRDYEFLSGKRLRLPSDPMNRPDDELLDVHFKRFLAHQSAA